jgi:hypothetical protein
MIVLYIYILSYYSSTKERNNSLDLLFFFFFFKLLHELVTQKNNDNHANFVAPSFPAGNLKLCLVMTLA